MSYALDDAWIDRDQLAAAGLRGNLDLAGRLEGVHRQECVGACLGHGLAVDDGDVLRRGKGGDKGAGNDDRGDAGEGAVLHDELSIRVATGAGCGGRGVVISDPCPTCHGHGRVQIARAIDVNIPAGVDTGSRVRIPGKGEGGRLGAPPGDLYIITNVGRHQHFTRKGDNIYVTVPITVPEAALGAKIEVPTLTGHALLTIEPGTQPGTILRMRDKGIPHLNAHGKGDELVRINVHIPTKINASEKELFKELADSANIAPKQPRNWQKDPAAKATSAA